ELGPTTIRRGTSPSSTAAEALRRYRDAAAGSPREVTTAFVLARDELSLRGIAGGSAPGGTALDALASPGSTHDPKGDVPFIELQRAADEALAWGRRYYSKGGFLADLTDDALRGLADSTRDMPIPDVEIYCIQLGGAVSDVDEDATAYSGRGAAFYWISQGVWDHPKDDEAAIAWCRRTARQLGALSMATNYVNEQAHTGIAHSSYGASLYRRRGRR